MKALLFLSAAGLGFVLAAGRKREPSYRFSKDQFRQLCLDANPRMSRKMFESLWASLDIHQSKSIRRSL